MARCDRAHAEHLLSQHRAREEVRPGQSPERKHVVGAGDHRCIQTLCAADHETDRPTAGQPTLQQTCQSLAVRRLAAGIECDDKGGSGQGRKQRRTLAPFHLQRSAARLGHLGDGKLRPQPRVVAGEQLGLRAFAKPSHGDQTQHRRSIYIRSMDTPDTTDNACADLSDDDRARLAEAARILLDARGIVIRASEWLGGRLHGVGQRFADLGPHLLGEDWQARYQTLVEGALRNAYRIGTLGLDPVNGGRSHRRVSRLVAAATGGASGFIGAPGIAADLPVTTCLMMRSIAAIARSHGEDLTSADTRQACIEVFAFGGPEIDDEDIDVAWWTIRGSLSHASITLVIRQVAARFGVVLSQKYLAQTVPLVGAAAGSTLNYVFMDYYQRMARVHFTLRELERRHDPDAVRACFDGLLRSAKSRRGRVPTRLLRANTRILDHAPPGDGGQGWTGRRSRARSMPAT